MSLSIIIYSGINVIPPFTVTVCDFYGNNCSTLGSGNNFPISFTLPNQYDSAPVLLITMVDSVGCTTDEIIYCTNESPKQFQNMEYFIFMNGENFDFQ